MSETNADQTKNPIDVLFEEMEKFVGTLGSDYKLSRQILAKNPADQMLRRMTIRNFCALVEGVIHEWKCLALLLGKGLKTEITPAEIAALQEETCELGQNGEAKSRPLIFSVPKNFKFASRMFARVFVCSYVVDYGGEGWKCLMEVFEVRNRLMHPRQWKGVEVSDDEVKLLKVASDWLTQVRLGLVGSCDMKAAVRNMNPDRN